MQHKHIIFVLEKSIITRKHSRRLSAPNNLRGTLWYFRLLWFSKTVRRRQRARRSCVGASGPRGTSLVVVRIRSGWRTWFRPKQHAHTPVRTYAPTRLFSILHYGRAVFIYAKAYDLDPRKEWPLSQACVLFTGKTFDPAVNVKGRKDRKQRLNGDNWSPWLQYGRRPRTSADLTTADHLCRREGRNYYGRTAVVIRSRCFGGETSTVALGALCLIFKNVNL